MTQETLREMFRVSDTWTDQQLDAIIKIHRTLSKTETVDNLPRMTYTKTQFNQRKAYARELGATIRYWRKFRGYTQEQLARELDLSDNALISRYEAGTVEMPVYRLAQIAFHLAVPVGSLIPSPHDPEAAFGSGPCKTYTE